MKHPNEIDRVLKLPVTTRRSALGWCIVAALLLFAGLHLAVRGPVDVKGNFNLCDFANHYAAARLWLIGMNPYDNAAVPVAWQASGPGAVRLSYNQWWSLLPPGALVVLAPLAALPPGWAIIVAIFGGMALLAAGVAAVLRIANFRADSLGAWLVIAGAAAAAPFQTLLGVGQASLVAVSCILIAIRCAQTRRMAWAGILLGLAGALKPQLALPFGIFYLLYRNWRLAGFAVATVFLLNLIGVAQLEWRGQPWFAHWIANLAASTLPGNANDPTFASPWRHQIISLNVLLFGITSSSALTSTLTALLAGLLIGAYVWLARRGRLSADSLLSLSIVATLGLLPVYHRSYDAALLILPLAWALSALRGPLRRSAWLTLAALAVFLVPFDALHLLQQKLRLFQTISTTWAWRMLIDPHHAWATLGVAATLLGALYIRVQQLATPVRADDAPEVLRLHTDQRASDTLVRWQSARERTRTRRTG